MLVYEKTVDNARHLYGTMGNIPANSDSQLTYKDSYGNAVEPTLSQSFVDDGKGGIKRVSDNKEINVFIGETNIIPGSFTPIAVSSIAITTAPTKTTYSDGDKLDLTGMVVTATYEDTTTTVVTGYTTSPEDGATLTTTDTKVTVTYEGKTAEQAITVS